jgi:protein TonB
LASNIGTTSVADRLSSTLFVAALAHGIVILGVTFAGDPFAESADAPPLNVTLLVDAAAPKDSDAELLASRNALGGGHEDSSGRPTTMLSAQQPFTQLGEIFGADLEHARPREAAPELEQLATRSPRDQRIQAVPEATESPAPVPMRAAALLNQAVPQSLAAELDAVLRNANVDDADAPTGPSARESLVAAYLVGWRQRVEKIGTANFPRDYLGTGELPSRPVLEVAIGAEGQLEEIVVRRSSGNVGLDQAALQILRMAAPFDPLPPAVLADRKVLRVVYEWDFSAG